jgi:transcriptional regulator with XRE-family HTH domain
MSAAAPPSPADESFGRRLRRERERRQIALASIAENSKIKVSLFEELERDDVSHWPSGVFRRAFIRAYADAVGLDADATAREFLERFPDPNDPDKRFIEPADGDKRGATPPGASAAAATAAAPVVPRATLRLTLADTGSSFSAGQLLASARSRCIAIAYDALIIVTLGLTLYLVLGTVWMPLCLALAGYYAGGILLLGNTPGVCLSASRGRWMGPTQSPPPRRADEPRSPRHHLRSANA